MKADASVIFEFNADDTKVNAKLAKLKNKVNEVQNELNSKTAQKTSLEKQFDDAKAAAKETEDAIKRLEAERARLSDLAVNYNAESPAEVAAAMDAHGRISEIDAELKAQNAALREQDKITQQIDKEYTKITDRVDTLSGNLDKAKTEAGSFEAQLAFANGPLGRMNAAADKTQKSVSRLRKRILELVKSALLFSVISSGLRSMMTYMGQAAMSNSDFAASLAQLKGALLTAFQPIYEAVLPALITLMNILARIINFIAGLFAALSGKTTAQMAENAESLNNEAEAIGAVGGAAKKAGKQLASFDEINQLQDNSSGGGSGGGFAGGISPDFGNTSELQGSLNNILGTISAIAAGFAAWKIARSLGMDLKTAAGLAAGVAGAVKFAFEWFDSLANGISLDNLLGMITSLALAAGGLTLAFGKTAASWALIIGGAALLIAAIVDIANNGLNLYNTLALIAGLFAVGLGIAVLTGNFIPLLVAGIAGLVAAFTVLMGHGEELAQGLEAIFGGLVDFIKGIFTGDMDLALQGIGELFEGLKLLIGSIIDSVKDLFTNAMMWLNEKTEGSFKPWIEIITSLFSGLFDGIKEILGGVIEFISGVFTGDWDAAWEGVKGIFSGIWNAIVSALEAAINFIVEGINLLISGLNKISIKMPDWLGGKQIGFNINKLSKVELPRLAQGAVIPPNREFMAVLGDQKSGTNIETPLATMIEAFKTAMRDMDTGGRGEAVLYIGEQEMGKLVYRLNKAETRRIGVSLSEG